MIKCPKCNYKIENVKYNSINEFNILSHPLRKKICNFVDKKPRSITQIQKHVGISYRNTLEHIKKLEKYGIVNRDKKVTLKGTISEITLKEE